MADYAQTVTVNTTSTAVATPLADRKMLMITNMDSANPVWIRLKPDGAAAVAEADENQRIAAGEAVLIPWAPSYQAIAVTAAVKINVVAAAGRF